MFKKYSTIGYRFIVTVLLIIIGFYASAQGNKKYQGLLWEVSGNGLKKPSYVYGTMHVSSKVAFHLDDSFFLAIENCDAVALEINADSFMADLMRSERMEGRGGYGKIGAVAAEDFLLYEKKSELLHKALSLDQNVVNFLMYRSSGYRDNFEEDTYLDLYIYKTGKKLKKIHLGVENWEESERLMNEAAKARSDEPYDPKRSRAANKMDMDKELVDAYRKGDLDMLDSINHIEDPESYLEKAIYQRNRNMVAAMDSMYKLGKSLFTAVGAAHLPGKKGVLEYLRDRGYTVRSVKHTEKNSKRRDQLDKVHHPLNFIQQTATDGIFKVEVPGRLFETGMRGKMQLYLCTDLVNGVYFDISRVKLYAPFIGNNQDFVMKQIDSLLYENVPGKIIEMKTIKKNGYPGYDILNQTKKGDFQRYNIIVTPLEVMIFKMAGPDDFVKNKDGDHFFNSIEIKETPATAWQAYSSKEHGFSVMVPHTPLNNETSDEYRYTTGRLDYLAVDKSTDNVYVILQHGYSNLSYLEEDTFELNQMMDGFAQTENVKEMQREIIKHKNQYAVKSNFTLNNRKVEALAVLKGSRYYIFAQSIPEGGSFDKRFLESIDFVKPQFKKLEEYNDTGLHFTVKTPYKPKKPAESSYSYYNSYSSRQGPQESETKVQLFTPPESDEAIRVEYYRYGKYISAIDTGYFRRLVINNLNDSDLYVVKKSEKHEKDIHTYDILYADTATARRHKYKFVLKGSVLYTLQCMIDSTEGESEFITTFYNTFKPADTTIGRPLFVSKADTLIKDLFSTDSATKSQAVESIKDVWLTDKSYKQWMGAIDSFYFTKNYLDRKADMIEELGYGWRGRKRDTMVLDYLKKEYIKVGDTTTLQLAILRSMTRFMTQESFRTIKNILLSEAPIPSGSYDLKGIFNNAEDSFRLARIWFPDLAKLNTIEEYKSGIYDLMSWLVDSNYLKPADYAAYKVQIYNDARITLKRQQAKEEGGSSHTSEYDDDLVNYTYLLLPFYSEPQIKKLIDKQFQSKNKEFRMRIVIAMIKSKVAVADSIIMEIADDDQLRYKLYQRMSRIKRLDLFPAKYKTQEAIARSIFMKEAVSSYSYSGSSESEVDKNKKDSIVLLDRRLTTFKHKTGYVYYYKVLKKNDEHKEWYVGISGMQPEDTSKISLDEKLTSSNTELLDESKKTEEQFEELLYEMRLKRRRGRSDYGY
ncbi:MAG: TraB/GumN family protein [Bacteroidota bacterium]|nr:TraB/GumN family protein [Bacteroidota bacterium]